MKFLAKQNTAVVTGQFRTKYSMINSYLLASFHPWFCFFLSHTPTFFFLFYTPLPYLEFSYFTPHPTLAQKYKSQWPLSCKQIWLLCITCVLGVLWIFGVFWVYKISFKFLDFLTALLLLYLLTIFGILCLTPSRLIRQKKYFGFKTCNTKKISVARLPSVVYDS